MAGPSSRCCHHISPYFLCYPNHDDDLEKELMYKLVVTNDNIKVARASGQFTMSRGFEYILANEGGKSQVFVRAFCVRSTPDRAVRVRGLTGDIAMSSWGRHLPLTVFLSIPVYKWVPANVMLGITLRWTSILQGE